MMHLHFVVDGPRDSGSIPRLVEKVVQRQVRESVIRWTKLHISDARGRRARRTQGYGPKLLLAIRAARDNGADGLVACVDRDTAPRGERLAALRAARTVDRQTNPPYPTALGEANPHAEAWLLDDPPAVRDALALDADVRIPTIRQTNSPKQTLNELIKTSRRRSESPSVLLADIARLIEARRCMHAKETGFRAFVDDLRAEIPSRAADQA